MSRQTPLAVSDLIFPEVSKSLTSTLTNLRRSNLSITNRLQSIKHDAEFVENVARTHQLPLIANERCGSWYIHPCEKAGMVYFKSTDGHFGQWRFNLRRLNLHLLEIIGDHGGCIIVDSTRRGKSMPDALSKTVPIWISVVNRFLFPEDHDSHVLHTPEEVISCSEHAQIEERLPAFVRDLAALALDKASLRARLKGKPMRPLWVAPESNPALKSSESVGHHSIVLCTASGRTPTTGQDRSNYVQGAADDSESWACGLTAAEFWTNDVQLSSTPEDDLPALIAGLMSERNVHGDFQHPVRVEGTSLSICDNATMRQAFPQFDFTICCSETPDERLASKLGHRHVHLACSRGKVGSRQLRGELSKICKMSPVPSPASSILVSCESGRDLAIGVAVAILCLQRNDFGLLGEAIPVPRLDKQVIKQRLSWIMLSIPDAKPSRATLQSVNAFLLGQSNGHPP